MRDYLRHQQVMWLVNISALLLFSNPVVAKTIAPTGCDASSGLSVVFYKIQFTTPAPSFLASGNGITFLRSPNDGYIALNVLPKSTLQALGVKPETPEPEIARKFLYRPFTHGGKLISRKLGNGETLYTRSTPDQSGWKPILILGGKPTIYINTKLPEKCFLGVLSTVHARN